MILCRNRKFKTEIDLKTRRWQSTD